MGAAPDATRSHGYASVCSRSCKTLRLPVSSKKESLRTTPMSRRQGIVRRITLKRALTLGKDCREEREENQQSTPSLHTARL